MLPSPSAVLNIAAREGSFRLQPPLPSAGKSMPVPLGSAAVPVTCPEATESGGWAAPCSRPGHTRPEPGTQATAQRSHRPCQTHPRDSVAAAQRASEHWRWVVGVQAARGAGGWGSAGLGGAAALGSPHGSPGQSLAHKCPKAPPQKHGAHLAGLPGGPTWDTAGICIQVMLLGWVNWAQPPQDGLERQAQGWCPSGWAQPPALPRPGKQGTWAPLHECSQKHLPAWGQSGEGQGEDTRAGGPWPS